MQGLFRGSQRVSGELQGTSEVSVGTSLKAPGTKFCLKVLSTRISPEVFPKVLLGEILQKPLQLFIYVLLYEFLHFIFPLFLQEFPLKFLLGYLRNFLKGVVYISVPVFFSIPTPYIPL